VEFVLLRDLGLGDRCYGTRVAQARIIKTDIPKHRCACAPHHLCRSVARWPVQSIKQLTANLPCARAHHTVDAAPRHSGAYPPRSSPYQFHAKSLQPQCLRQAERQRGRVEVICVICATPAAYGGVWPLGGARAIPAERSLGNDHVSERQIARARHRLTGSKSSSPGGASKTDDKGLSFGSASTPTIETQSPV